VTQAYPLVWPQGWPRTAARTSSKFGTSVSGAVRNVLDELRRFGKDSGKPVENIVVSSNVTLTDQRPGDPGVAAYFRWEKIDCCIAIDRYNKAEDNLQAIAKVVEAERTKLRHGGLNIVRAGFRGFAALPPPTGPAGQISKPWREVLGIALSAKLPEAESAYRTLVKTHHPDRGGDAAQFNAITDAIRQARIDFGG
jgi:hypothetical protein